MEDAAWIYMKSGNYSEALKTIRKLLSKPGPLTAKLLEIDPKWEALRDLPGYKKLIDKYSIEVVPIPAEEYELPEQNMELPEVTGPSFTDERDGNFYHYKQIGEQVWMTENLAFLPDVSLPDSLSISEAHYYVYDYRGKNVAEARESPNYAQYGALYNFEAALKACPDGWHLPGDKEWKTLEKYLGMAETEADFMRLRTSGSIGFKLRSEGGWKNKGNGDNSSGFFAFPGGFLHQDMNFYHLGLGAAWWSSTKFDNTQSMSRQIHIDFTGINREGVPRNYGLSVRCIKD
jgi:uncharacterized protein (TIGR02145 family)